MHLYPNFCVSAYEKIQTFNTLFNPYRAGTRKVLDNILETLQPAYHVFECTLIRGRFRRLRMTSVIMAATISSPKIPPRTKVEIFQPKDSPADALAEPCA